MKKMKAITDKLTVIKGSIIALLLIIQSHSLSGTEQRETRNMVSLDQGLRNAVQIHSVKLPDIR